MFADCQKNMISTTSKTNSPTTKQLIERFCLILTRQNRDILHKNIIFVRQNLIELMFLNK